MLRILRLLLGLGALTILSTAASAQGKTFPSAEEVKTLLQKEPINDASWPAWKQRLIEWFGDPSRQTDDAYKEAARYVGGCANAAGRLPPRFDDDHLAWYMLGSHYLDRKPARTEDLALAELAERKSIAIKPEFGRAHRNLAMVLTLQAASFARQANIGRLPMEDHRLKAAEAELLVAAKLDSSLVLDGYHGMIAQTRGDLPAAIRHFEYSLRKEPHQSGWAIQLVQCILMEPPGPERSSRIQPYVERYPKDGVLATLFAVGLAMDNRPRDASAELERARSLGTDPAQVLSPEIVRQIEDAARPGFTELYLKIMMWFGISYAVVMLLMAGAGVSLAFYTRGTGALNLLENQTPAELVRDGHVARVHGESILARLYGFTLMCGLILFYAAIPFVIAGLLGGTFLLLYVIFTSADRIPLKIVLVILVVGGFSAWAVFKSLFTRPASGAFGILKTSEQCPRLHALLGEVAGRVDTDPVNEVHLGPGAGIGVHQEGKGPFGMFGISKRVLTLGFCTLRFLTVGELKAILAHEYAHFSHSDTFYSRFIYQVHMSIEEALWGMAGAGGWITYINPFYWFLWLYYKSYSLLSAGYSRSREFLADRMAATLYGAAQFKNALEKVSTDGTLFEMTMYDNISHLLNEQKAFINMYDAFHEIRNEQISSEDRQKLYQNLLGEQGSLFASHPTFAERAAAIASFPAVTENDDRPALDLFDDVPALESELTKFLTEYMAYVQYLQLQAAQQEQ